MRIVTLFTGQAGELCNQSALTSPKVALIAQRDITGVLTVVRSGAVHAALIEDDEVRLGHWLAVMKSQGLSQFPTVIVGAGRPGDITRAIRCGAADYASFTDGAESILARLEARVEARDRPDESRALQVGPFLLNRPKHRVTCDGHDVELTAREFELAWMLFERRGRVVSVETLAAQVWGRSADISKRSIQQHVYRLRCKLGCSSSLRGAGLRVQTVYGVGYRLHLRVPSDELAGEERVLAPHRD